MISNWIYLIWDSKQKLLKRQPSQSLYSYSSVQCFFRWSFSNTHCLNYLGNCQSNKDFGGCFSKPTNSLSGIIYKLSEITFFFKLLEIIAHFTFLFTVKLAKFHHHCFLSNHRQGLLRTTPSSPVLSRHRRISKAREAPRKHDVQWQVPPGPLILLWLFIRVAITEPLVTPCDLYTLVSSSNPVPVLTLYLAWLSSCLVSWPELWIVLSLLLRVLLRGLD